MKDSDERLLKCNQQTTSDDARYLVKRFALTAIIEANAGSEADFERVWRCAFPDTNENDLRGETLEFANPSS